MSGLMSVTGSEPDVPTKVGVPICDLSGGLFCAFGIVAAYVHKLRTGEGQLVEVPLVEAAVNLSAEQVIEYSAYGRVLTRTANRGRFAALPGPVYDRYFPVHHHLHYQPDCRLDRPRYSQELGTIMATTDIADNQFIETELNVSAKRTENLFRILFMIMAGLLILPVLVILTTLVVKGSSIISFEFLFSNPTNGMTEGGIFPALLGTVWLVGVALLISVPVGVAAAVYLSEYAPDNWFTRAINLAIINLAGVPSIVHALFGVGAFVIFFGFGTSILAASMTLAVMTLPVVIVATRESLQAVPPAFREACWNMGATRWQTIRRVVLPNSVSGILTGVILEVSRTTGETAPIMFTGAAFFIPVLPESVFDQTMALSLHLFVVSTQVPHVPDALPYGVALVLISMVLLMNSASIALRMHLRGKKKW